MRVNTLLMLGMLVGCGNDTDPGAVDARVQDGSSVDDAPIDTPANVFTLTSPTVSEGVAIPAVHSCDGANTSPALAWTNPPANTMGFAVVLTDRYNMLVHAVIYDIPSTLTELPADIEKVYAPADVPGAHQTVNYMGGNNRGYAGPCPPPADPAHNYEFAVYAINATTLGAAMNTDRASAMTLITNKMLGVAKLTGTFDR